MTDSNKKAARHAQVAAVRPASLYLRAVFVAPIATAPADDARLDEEEFAALSNEDQTSYLDSLPYFDPDYDARDFYA